MKKILIFGTGSSAKIIRPRINQSLFKIVAFIDNNNSLQGNNIDHIPILAPSEIPNCQYDYIVIASQFFTEIKAQLEQLNVPKNKILPWYYKGFDESTFFRLSNRKISIISDDCWGGFVYRSINSKYYSPFIWTSLYIEDYLKLLNSPLDYFHHNLKFLDNQNVKFPVAELGNIKINFVHYHDKEEAQTKWNERTQRLDWNNCIVKATITNEQHAIEFEKLQFKNKVAFTNANFGLSSCIWIQDWHDQSGDFYEYVRNNFDRYFNIYHWLSNI